MKEEEEEICGCCSSKGNVLLTHYNVSYFSSFLQFFLLFVISQTFYLAIFILRVYVMLFVHVLCWSFLKLLSQLTAYQIGHSQVDLRPE